MDMLDTKAIGSNEIAILTPDSEGTKVQMANKIQEIHDLMKSGLTASEAIIPKTSPKNIEQLQLFDTYK